MCRLKLRSPHLLAALLRTRNSTICVTLQLHIDDRDAEDILGGLLHIAAKHRSRSVAVIEDE